MVFPFFAAFQNQDLGDVDSPRQRIIHILYSDVINLVKYDTLDWRLGYENVKHLEKKN